jgi:hypothetical protein
VHGIFIIIIFLSSFKILYDPFCHRSSLYYILFNGRDSLHASGEVFVVKLAFRFIQGDLVIGEHSSIEIIRLDLMENEYSEIKLSAVAVYILTFCITNHIKGRDHGIIGGGNEGKTNIYYVL